MLIVRILVEYALQVTLTQCQMVQFVLEDHTAMIESILDDLVTGLYLFLGEWYLSEVVFPFVGIIGSTVHRVGQ